MGWMKEHRSEPSRALLERELLPFLGQDPSLPLHPYVELVKSREELALCFRGNDPRAPRICIYSGNHIVFTVYTNGKTVISFDHARYCEHWQRYFHRLTEEFGFSGRIRRTSKGHISVGTMSRFPANSPPLERSQLQELYHTILRPIFDAYFSAGTQGQAVDYFRQGALVRVPERLEKRRQQELFRKFTFTKNGYFFYDMEFSQRHEDMASQRSDQTNNKPDMLAIRFDPQGQSERLVFVEVKSTKAAMRGASGLVEHLGKMERYEHLADRRREACQLMNQYAQLGLRGLSPQVFFPWEDFEHLPLELLLVFTDEAAELWQNHPTFAALRRRTSEVTIPECPEARLFALAPSLSGAHAPGKTGNTMNERGY